eukprot:m.158052 g.158052  ORF g.158052 m.158052 type:complete len:553 (+) comp38719_c0_seq32:110-1768(+)
METMQATGSLDIIANPGWERWSYRTAVVKTNADSAPTKTVETAPRDSGGTHPAPRSLSRRFCGPIIFATCAAVVLLFALLPLLLTKILEQPVPDAVLNATVVSIYSTFAISCDVVFRNLVSKVGVTFSNWQGNPTSSRSTLVHLFSSAELGKVNVSVCPHILLPSGQGGCYFPCNQSEWLADPTARRARTIGHYLIGILLVASGIIVTSIWIKLGKSQWKFPHILLWYITMSLTGLGSVSLSTVLLGRDRVACSSEDLYKTPLNSTLACNTLGSLFHFFGLALMFWTASSSANMWWCICYPTRATTLFVNATKIHLLESLLCWLVPALCVAINFGVEGRYSMPLLGSSSYCSPSTRGLLFATFALPTMAASMVTVILLVHTVYSLQKQGHFRKKISEISSSTHNVKEVQQIESLKIKFFFFAGFVTLYSLMNGISSGINMAYYSKINYLIYATILCWMNASQALNSSTASAYCPEKFRDYQFPALEILHSTLLLFGVLSTLNYVLTIKRARTLLWKWLAFPFRCFRSEAKREQRLEFQNAARSSDWSTASKF